MNKSILYHENFTTMVSDNWIKYYQDKGFTHFKCFDCGSIKPLSEIHIEVTELENKMVCKDCQTDLQIISSYSIYERIAVNPLSGEYLIIDNNLKELKEKLGHFDILTYEKSFNNFKIAENYVEDNHYGKDYKIVLKDGVFYVYIKGE